MGVHLYIELVLCAGNDKIKEKRRNIQKDKGKKDRGIKRGVGFREVEREMREKGGGGGEYMHKSHGLSDFNIQRTTIRNDSRTGKNHREGEREVERRKRRRRRRRRRKR